MKVIDFNQDFAGFEENEAILIDTGIILALLNKYDAWHTTSFNLFKDHISNDRNGLYTHSSIIGEVLHLSDKPTKSFMRSNQIVLPEEDIDDAINLTIKGILELVENEYVVILNSDIKSSLLHIKYAKYFGSTDSLTVSIAESYGISLLTVDRKLMNNLYNRRNEFPNIKNIYFTTSAYIDY